MATAAFANELEMLFAISKPVTPVVNSRVFPSGNVMKNSIREIWQSKTMRQRREWHLQNKKGNVTLCKDCNVWDEGHGEELISSEYAEKVSISQTSKQS